MAITITTTASDTKLTTLTRVKSELGISSTTDDSLLLDNIKEATDIIESYTNRKFARVTLTETLPGSGRNELVLTRTPVVSVSAITDDGTTVSSTKYTIDNPDAGILYREDGWRDTRLWAHNVEDFPLNTGGKREWSVTYVGGYVTPGATNSTERNLPYDIERAAIELVKVRYLRRKEDPLIQSQRTGDASETLFTGGGGMPQYVTTILNKWRRIEI